MSIKDYVQDQLDQLDQHREITEEDVQRVLSLNSGETEEEIRKRFPIGEKGVYVMIEHPTSGKFPKLELDRILTSNFNEFDEKYEFIRMGNTEASLVPYFRPKS